MIKAMGHLLQNSIAPMIKDLSDILWFMESNAVPINKDSLESLAKKAVIVQVGLELVRGLTQIVIASIICYTVWRIYA